MLEVTETPEANDLVPLAEVAAELRTQAWRLAALSRNGQFPSLLKVTRKHYLVRRADVEAWKTGRWTQAALPAPVVDAPAVKKRTPKTTKRTR